LNSTIFGAAPNEPDPAEAGTQAVEVITVIPLGSFRQIARPVKSLRRSGHFAGRTGTIQSVSRFIHKAIEAEVEEQKQTAGVLFTKSCHQVLSPGLVTRSCHRDL
jgi:hypothetical protein